MLQFQQLLLIERVVICTGIPLYWTNPVCLRIVCIHVHNLYLNCASLNQNDSVHNCQYYCHESKYMHVFKAISQHHSQILYVPDKYLMHIHTVTLWQSRIERPGMDSRNFLSESLHFAHFSCIFLFIRYFRHTTNTLIQNTDSLELNTNCQESLHYMCEQYDESLARPVLTRRSFRLPIRQLANMHAYCNSMIQESSHEKV